jgi:hypothetical protein
MGNIASVRRSVLPLLLVMAVLSGSGYALVQHAGAGTVSSVYQAPTSIDRTGATDVTAKLVSFIKSVPDGSTITFPAGSRYRIENIVLIGGRHNLAIDGAGAVFFATTDGSGVSPTGPNGVRMYWPRHRNQFLVYDSSNITVRNLVVRGANAAGGQADIANIAALEAQAGFEFMNTTNSTLENCTVDHTYGDLVYIGTGSNGTTVQNCNLSASGRQGVTVASANTVVLARNKFSEIRRSAVDLEPYSSTWGVTNVWIVYNTFSGVRLNVIASKGSGDVSTIIIAYNTMIGEPLNIRNTPVSTVTPARHNWYVIGNHSDTVFGAPSGCYWITYTKTVVIKDNYQPLEAGRNQIGIETTFSTDVQVSGNSFPLR